MQVFHHSAAKTPHEHVRNMFPRFIVVSTIDVEVLDVGSCFIYYPHLTISHRVLQNVVLTNEPYIMVSLWTL